MDTLFVTGIVILCLIVVIIVASINASFRKLIIMEYETGLLFSKGTFVKSLGAGQYKYKIKFEQLHVLDNRPQIITLAGQELLTSDGMTVRISVTGIYKIVDPKTAWLSCEDVTDTLYLTLQIAIRKKVETISIDDVISNRNIISEGLLEAASDQVSQYGIELISVDVKDLMLGREIREMYSKILNARQEGLVKLEKARGESAAIRNLANSAKLIEDHPGLMQLKLMETISESSDKTFYISFGDNPGIIPVPGVSHRDSPAQIQ